MRRCRPPAAGCRRRPWPTASARTRFPGSSDPGCGATRRPRRARRLLHVAQHPASSAAEMNAPQRVQRFPVTGIEAPRAPPGPSPRRGRRRPGRRPARSDEISHFAVAGGTRDPVQCAGGRETLRSARSALSVSDPAQASAANHIGGYLRVILVPWQGSGPSMQCGCPGRVSGTWGCAGTPRSRTGSWALAPGRWLGRNRGHGGTTRPEATRSRPGGRPRHQRWIPR